MRRFRFIFGLAFLCAAALPVFAASNSADAVHLHVQLVVPEKVLMAGVPTNAGLYFKLEPGWHVYWKNPGDSGEPTAQEWADALGTLSYEIVTRFAGNMPRSYTGVTETWDPILASAVRAAVASAGQPGPGAAGGRQEG